MQEKENNHCDAFFSQEVTTPLLGQPPGLSVFMTTVFIMSDMMAASVVALPAAVEATGELCQFHIHIVSASDQGREEITLM